MSTLDLKGCLRKLDALLRVIKYPRDVDYNSLSKGDPSAFLPIVSFTFTSFSPLLAEQLVLVGLELTGKTDLRFIDALYKVLRDMFQYKPILSKQQFLQWGFSQRKISVICDIINLVLQRHNQLKKPRARCPISQSDSRVEALPPLTDPGNTLSDRPLVVSHMGNPAPFPTNSSHNEAYSSHSPEHEIAALAGGEREDKEDVPQYQAVEGRLSVLEAQLENVLSGLDRLTAMETRLEKLESWRDTDKGDKNERQFITIPKKSWDNLLSRVLLLETKLELSNATDSVPSPCLSSTSPYCSTSRFDAPQNDLKDTLEKITNMMNNTSSLLKNAKSSI